MESFLCGGKNCFNSADNEKLHRNRRISHIIYDTGAGFFKAGLKQGLEKSEGLKRKFCFILFVFNLMIEWSKNIRRKLS